MKLHTISFGCQMSSADGEEMSRPWLARGFSLSPELDDADAVIVGTCTVRQHAEDRALSQIGRLKPWKEARPDRFLLVAGCAAERLGGWIQKRFPYVDLVVGARSIEEYPRLLEAALAERFDWARENAGLWTGALPDGGPSPVSALVTIMRGCNYSCSYCIVPAVRGREIYRPFDTILEEVRRRVRGGTREAVLLGQTVNSYRDRSGADFADLLRALDAVPELARIRFTSPHPFFLNERMMRAMAECPKVARHLHLPAQSGSDRLLTAMRRNYTRRQYLDRVAALRRLIPDLALSTDLIVGFPGETESDFEQTLSLLAESDFCSAYCFKFSPREGTAAFSLPEQVPQAVSERRLASLLETVERATRGKLERLVGRPVDLLMETPRDGRTQYHFKARLDEPRPVGSLTRAVVTGSTRTALKCRPLIPCVSIRSHATV